MAVEQGRREPLGLARRAAVHAVGDLHLDDDQHVARDHARLGGPAEPRRDLGRRPARAGRVRRRLVQPGADGQGRPRGPAARAHGDVERPPVHAASRSRAPSSRSTSPRARSGCPWSAAGSRSASAPTPDTRATVVVGSVDSGVPNRTLAGTCTISDHLLDEEVWPNHSTFVSHLTKLADELLAARRRERGGAQPRSSTRAPPRTVGGDEEQAPVGATVPATLSLALRRAGDASARSRPGVAKEYTASTTAERDQHGRRRDADASDPSPRARPADERDVRAAARRCGRGDRAGDAGPRPVSNAAVAITFRQHDRSDRRAAHGRLQQDADVHVVDDVPVDARRARSRP